MTGEVPLAELSGYSTHLRTVTSGRASISMQLSHYQVSHNLVTPGSSSCQPLQIL